MAVSGAWSEKIDCKRHKRTFWNNRNILYLDGCGLKKCIHLSKLYCQDL